MASSVEYKDFNDKPFLECFEGTYANHIDEDDDERYNNRFGYTNR